MNPSSTSPPCRVHGLWVLERSKVRLMMRLCSVSVVDRDRELRVHSLKVCR